MTEKERWPKIPERNGIAPIPHVFIEHLFCAVPDPECKER